MAQRSCACLCLNVYDLIKQNTRTLSISVFHSKLNLLWRLKNIKWEISQRKVLSSPLIPTNLSPRTIHLFFQVSPHGPILVFQSDEGFSDVPNWRTPENTMNSDGCFWLLNRGYFYFWCFCCVHMAAFA